MNWSEKSLDQLGYVSRGKSRHRPRDASHLFGGPYPFIQTGDVKHANLFINEYKQTYSEQGLAQSKLWPVGTLCITIAANIGDTAILGIPACFPDSVIGFIPDEEKADVRFMKYLFDAILQRKYRTFTQGAAQDNLSQAKLLSIKFPVPNLKVQKRVGRILSNYDELIENNKKRITLLEQVARLIYKEWFVHYRFPGYENAEIVGGLPEGWMKKPLRDVGYLNYGRALKQEQRLPGIFPVYGSSGVVGVHEKPLVSGPAIIIGRKGNVGSVYWSDSDFYPIDTVYYISPEECTFYLYYALQNTQFINTDVAVPGLNRDLAHSRLIIIPDEKTLIRFNETISEIHKLIMNLTNNNIKLMKARDLLLPRLIKGEIALDQNE